MTFDEFNIELGTVLYLDSVSERERPKSLRESCRKLTYVPTIKHNVK